MKWTFQSERRIHMKGHTDNMKIQFNIIVEEAELDKGTEDIINKPITVNDIPVGVITDAQLDESGLYYNCHGVIWNRFINIEFMRRNNSSLELASIKIK
jgi:hypothetical protein